MEETQPEPEEEEEEKPTEGRGEPYVQIYKFYEILRNFRLCNLPKQWKAGKKLILVFFKLF